MSKLVIVLFTVLTVVALNASCTPLTLENHRGMTENDITATETYIVNKYDDAVKEHDNLKNDIKIHGAERLANAKNHIMTIVNAAREHIENLKDGVELLDDEACLYHADHLTDKTAEASTNLTNCVSAKSNVSTDSEFVYITNAKLAKLYEAGNLRDELSSCIDDNKSNSDEAEKCLFQVQVKTFQLRSSIDVSTTRHMARIREMFASAAQSFDFCEKEYGAPNYSKITTSIVNEVAGCFKTGAHAHHIPVDSDV